MKDITKELCNIQAIIYEAPVLQKYVEKKQN